MNQQGWLDLWHHFLQVMSGEPIATRIVIGIAIAFFATMSLTGMVDSFLPRRAARRYAAMYDLTPAIAVERQSFIAEPPTPAEEPAPLELDEPDEASDDLRLADGGVNVSTPRRSTPPPPKVFRAQKP